MRNGVAFVAFDLPAGDCKQRAAAARFRKELLKSGYQAIQKSVYYKLLHNISAHEAEREALKQIAPPDGNVIMLPLSQGSFMRISAIAGAAPGFDRIFANVFAV